MIKKILILFLIVGLIILGSYCYYRSQIKSRAVKGDQPHSAKVIFVVEEGWGVEEIASQLQQQSLINSRLVFYGYLLKHGFWSQLRPGEYQINSSSTIPEVVAILINGSPSEKKITIKEGWNIKEIEDLLVQEGLIEKGRFKTQAQKSCFKDDFPFLKAVKGESLEGYLFPDSYFVYPKSNSAGADFDPQIFISKMLTAFDQKAYSKYKDSDYPKPLKLFSQLVVLASIVEKEASNQNDRCLVAGIFLKRLSRGCRLQACSTVNYLLDEPKEILKESDLRVDSSYNTYRYKGLPPGPISNPGLGSIEAVLKPKTSKYWYFLSDREGKIHYSQTAEEHSQNKKRYL